MRFAFSTPGSPSIAAAAMAVLVIVSMALPLAGCGKGESPGDGTGTLEVSVPVNSRTAFVVDALPESESGLEIDGKPDISPRGVPVKDGYAELNITEEPVWLIEGELPEERALATEESPFGFHPASVQGANYEYAEEIGVVWDRGGMYLFWVLGQPDLNSDEYEWEIYDRYFQALPPGFMTLKNITVAHDHMVERPGTPEQQGGQTPGTIDISQHLEGTTYRPSDPDAYSKWVRAAVERYDGDGIDDMPGLTTGVEYWQVDNEPPRGREGYPDLVRITSRAIKEADPEARILIGGLVAPCSHMVKHYERESLPIIEDLGGEGADILDIHYFGQTGEWKYIPEAVARAREDLASNGFNDAAIWFTEMGTYSGRPVERSGRSMPEQSEREQASEMVKRYSVALGSGVEKILWAWGMMEGFSDVNDNDFFDNTGFIYDGVGPGDPGRGVRKIVFWSYQKMTELLGYWDGSPPEELEVGEGITAYRFQFGNEDGRGIIAMWLSDNTTRGD